MVYNSFILDLCSAEERHIFFDNILNSILKGQSFHSKRLWSCCLLLSGQGILCHFISCIITFKNLQHRIKHCPVHLNQAIYSGTDVFFMTLHLKFYVQLCFDQWGNRHNTRLRKEVIRSNGYCRARCTNVQFVEKAWVKARSLPSE